MIALFAVLAGWVALRTILWDTPFPDPGPVMAHARSAPAVLPRFAIEPPESAREPIGSGTARPVRASDQRGAPSTYVAARIRPPAAARSVEPFTAPFPREIAVRTTPEAASLPSDALLPSVGPPLGPVRTEVQQPGGGMQKRWRVDAWAQWRAGGGLPRVATGGPIPLSYGANQAGFVARTNLGSGANAPQMYLRAVHSPARPSQSDVAVGFSFRPLSRLPVRLQGEARGTHGAGRTELRPAVFAVTEVPPVALPARFLAEGYLQGGWVGGRYATGFVDGQARLDRSVTHLGPVDFRLGAGVWGGAQQFARRLDVGPSATLDMRGAGVPARLSVDYRAKVAGNARPGDGIAVTLATSF